MREGLAPGALHPGGEHSLDLGDALAGDLRPADVEWIREQIAARAKGELRPARSGAVPAHAAWSSTALAGGAFAPWRADPAALRVAGLGGFTGLRLEERLLIPHGGGAPNLDVALRSPGAIAGVEAKLTEHLAPRRARPWPPAYRRPAMAAELTGGWAETFHALLAGSWAPEYLDAPQLVRHALSLRPLARDQGLETTLVLLFWEPARGGAHPEVRRHREEVAELLDRIGTDAAPRLRALSYAELWATWAPLRPAHVDALRARYEVEVEPV